MAEFVLNVPELEEGLTDRTFVIRPEWLSEQLEGVEGIDAADGPGTIELAATRNGREVFIRGTAAVALRLSCVRCLEVFDFAIDAELEVLMLPGRSVPKGAKTKSEGDEPEDDDLGVERYQGDTIALDDLIRDTILLEVPMNPNCGETCTGWDRLGG